MKFPDGSEITTQDGATISTVSGDMAMEAYRLHMLVSSLNLEINTGMKISGKVNTLKVAESWAGQTFGRGVAGKRKALNWAETALSQLLGEATV
jgi:hypothetical protein